MYAFSHAALSRVRFSLWDGERLLRAATLPLEANASGRRGSSQPSAIAVDPTSSFIAVGDCSGGVRVWDVSQTSGAILARNPQDAPDRPPASISFISWFKAHARRVKFIAFTSNTDIVTISSGARVRVWSVMGVEIGKVGGVFQLVAGVGGGRGMCQGGEGEEPEVSSRDMAADDDDDAAAASSSAAAAVGGGENRVGDGSSCDDASANDDDDNDDDDDGNGSQQPAAAAFGQTAAQVMKLQRQRHGKLSRRFVCGAYAF
jgi:WD40 repeat protein